MIGGFFMSKTKDRIIDMAINMFNEKGTSPVSTNHIAKELGMSPGNLYYYFKNKQEIIRSILERMVLDWDVVWNSPKEDWHPSLEDLKSTIRYSFQLEWTYRFFYRELIVLMNTDSLLKERHQQIQSLRIEEQTKFFQMFIDEGVIRVPKENASLANDLLKVSWIISNYWLAFVETSGDKVSEEKVEEGVQLIMTVINPYIMKGGE